MTRRWFIGTAATGAIGSAAERRMAAPVHRIVDARGQMRPDDLREFWKSIWPEAFRDLQRGGIELKTTDGPGEIRRSPGGRPIFEGLRRGVINLVLTDHIAMEWDMGRTLSGVSGLHEGYCVCVLALRYAHGDQIPFLSVNTLVHELLHVLLGDIFVGRRAWYQSVERESRIDWYATRLWLFGDGGEIRENAAASLRRLRTAAER